MKGKELIALLQEHLEEDIKFHITTTGEWGNTVIETYNVIGMNGFYLLPQYEAQEILNDGWGDPPYIEEDYYYIDDNNYDSDYVDDNDDELKALQDEEQKLIDNQENEEYWDKYNKYIQEEKAKEDALVEELLRDINELLK